MSGRVNMLKAITQLSADFAHETNPIDVVDLLQHVSMKADLKSLGAWRLPLQKTNWNQYHRGRNVFWHPAIPNAEWQDFLALSRRHGASPLTQLAWKNQGPFTFAEGLRKLQPSSEDRWIWDFHRARGRVDALYCPCGRWQVILSSNKPLRLPAQSRAMLFAAANIAVSRMEEIIDHRGLDHESAPLSPRELAVLVQLSHGHSSAEIASKFELSVSTVKTHLARAEKKLGTHRLVHTVAEAIRRGLIV